MGENKLYCMRCFEAMEDSSNTCPHCGWHNGDQVKNALPYGTLLGEKYLVGQAVHVNGAGITYAALEAKTAQKVEVREFYPHTIAVRGETGASVLPVSGAELKFSDYLSEFERYAQKLLRVSDTKHIQRAIDTFSQNNTQYIVFSFTESVSLRQYVEEHGALSWAQCEQFFYPVIHTLGAIHAQNVEHLGILRIFSPAAGRWSSTPKLKSAMRSRTFTACAHRCCLRSRALRPWKRRSASRTRA